MATDAKLARFRKQMTELEAWKKAPDKVKYEPRQRIRIRMRCKLCGRPRAVYRKFGICRICFRNLASDGMIPGVKSELVRETAMMTDPIADMLTRIRNANRIERPAVDMPATRLKANVAKVLKDEGFILDYQVGKEGTDEHGAQAFQAISDLSLPKLTLRVYLKYGPEGEKVIRHIERVSRPGRRLYVHSTEIKPVLDGLGISVISTNKGVLSDRQAKAQRVGGELLCIVW